ncbi:hypothetical protein MASR1M12_25500 [Erysipelotrichia bacterium]
MKRKKNKGQAIVELALVFPFFLLIILGGIIDFGFAFYNYVTLRDWRTMLRHGPQKGLAPGA